jgi:rhodanese-related sulfurtransferase
MVAEARSRVENLTPMEVLAALDGDTLLVDVREEQERRNDGFIPGDVFAPRGMLEFWADPESAHHRGEFDPERRVILYCASGGRSALAADTLQRLGYGHVAHLDGGLRAWKENGKMLDLPGEGSSEKEVETYDE